jgi:hypothetical protein
MMSIHLPMEVPATVGTGARHDRPGGRVIVLPVEVHRTGALVRARAQLFDPPPELLANPGAVLVALPGSERMLLSLSLLGRRLGGRRVDAAGGRADGPARWDVEFWWPVEDWHLGPVELQWPIIGLRTALNERAADLVAAAQHLP